MKFVPLPSGLKLGLGFLEFDLILIDQYRGLFKLRRHKNRLKHWSVNKLFYL